MSDRPAWLEQRCPECRAAPGARCSHWRWGAGANGRAVPAAHLHVARGWFERQCLTCKALPGERCVTPTGREAAQVHVARLRPTRGELVWRLAVWEELERRGATVAIMPFSGRGGRSGAVTADEATRGSTRPGQARVLEALPDRLDRLVVRQLVLEKPWTARGMFEAMIIVYAWGWSTTPVGVTRAQSTVGAGVERLGSALLAARYAMRTGGPRDGYAALKGPHRVAGLGPSFGSKFLYYVSPEDGRALILDQLVADWLARDASLSLNAARWSVRTYEAYLSTMNRWSSALGIPSHQLEEILFTEEATRRGLAAWAAR